MSFAVNSMPGGYTVPLAPGGTSTSAAPLKKLETPHPEVEGKAVTQRLSRGKAWKRFGKNVGRAMVNQGESILQNPAAFKGNALILASLVLATSRILVASATAMKAQGTPEGPYRMQESIRTAIREMGGFTSSFGLLVIIMTVMRASMRRAWGIPTVKSSGMFSEIKHAFKHRHDPDYKPPRPNYQELLSRADNFVHNHDQSKGTIKAANAIRSMFGKVKLDHAGENRFIRRVYTWSPVAVGGLVSFYVSGKLLEQFTRQHSGDVINWISSHSKGAVPGTDTEES